MKHKPSGLYKFSIKALDFLMGCVTLWVRSDSAVTINLTFRQDMGMVYDSQYKS